MMYNYPMYGGYQQPYYPNNGAMPDQLAQLRGGQQYQAAVPAVQQTAPANAFSGTSIVWINGGYKEAMDYPVAPNSAVGLWDFNANTLFFKQADASGKPTMEIYKTIKENTEAQTPQQAPQISLGDFVTRDEFNALQAKFEALTSHENTKGKKKTVPTADDDTKEND